MFHSQICVDFGYDSFQIIYLNKIKQDAFKSNYLIVPLFQ